MLAFLSQARVELDLSLEIFFVDGPLEGFGAVDSSRRIDRPSPRIQPPERPEQARRLPSLDARSWLTQH